MALSRKKLGVLNNLIKYIAALRKGQFSASDGGDIRLGDLLGNYRLVAAGNVTMAAKPTLVVIPGILTTDIPVGIVNTDDGGAALVCIAATIAADGTLTLTQKGALGGGAGVAKYLVLRAQS